jgi:hypothetical protein
MLRTALITLNRRCGIWMTCAVAHHGGGGRGGGHSSSAGVHSISLKAGIARTTPEPCRIPQPQFCRLRFSLL